MKADSTFDYMMLGRLQSDCEYFLHYGNGVTNRLWANSVFEQIKEMERIFNLLPIPPKWISMKKIRWYHRKMVRKSFLRNGNYN
jgi:hypothetical protein